MSEVGAVKDTRGEFTKITDVREEWKIKMEENKKNPQVILKEMAEETDKKVREYLKILTEKWDIVIEHPERYWEVIATIAVQGEAMPDVAMVVVKEEYRKEVAKLIVGMVRGTASVMKAMKK